MISDLIIAAQRAGTLAHRLRGVYTDGPYDRLNDYYRFNGLAKFHHEPHPQVGIDPDRHTLLW